MASAFRYLVHNPPSLRLLSACSIRQTISRMGEHIENNLIEKLTAGDIDDLRNPNAPISLEDMCKYYTFPLQKPKNCFSDSIHCALKGWNRITTIILINRRLPYAYFYDNLH